MNEEIITSTLSREPKKRSKWPLKTLIEILPVIIALTALFSYSTIRNITDVALITPLNEVLEATPFWVAGLMGLILLVGCLGIGWLIYIFSRAPVAPDGSADDS
jgi:phosphate/sulfate permease